MSAELPIPHGLNYVGGMSTVNAGADHTCALDAAGEVGSHEDPHHRNPDPEETPE